MRRILTTSITTLVAALMMLLSVGAMDSAQAARAVTPVPKVAPASATTLDEFEVQLMVEINKARRANGLRRIAKFDSCADRLAEGWGARIARTGAFVHRNQNDVIRRCSAAWAGETLIRGYDMTPDSMVTAWLNSPGHRAILLSPRPNRAGIAVTVDSQGRQIGVLNVVRAGR